MKSRLIAALGLASAFACPGAYAQSTILEGGPTTDGHAPMYVGDGTSQAVVQDSGPAGGALGLGLSELLLTYRSAGTGPGGTNLCDYDAPIDSAGGYHYLCLGATSTGGLLNYGAVGSAPALPLTISIDGQQSLVIGDGGIVAGLPLPTPTSLGGVFSSSAPANQFATGINTSGAVTYGQPSFSNLSGTIASGQVAGSYTGITGLGTVTVGTWNGSIVAPAFGGTGVNNGARTLTLGGNLATSGAFASTFTMSGPTAVTFPTTGTLATLQNNLGQFAATTSAQLAGAITDETGTGSLVFGTSPTLITPTLGAATATSINGNAITASTGTLTLAAGKTLTANNTLTLAGTDGSTINVGAGGTLGTAAFDNTGTSGATIPLLNGTNTWSAVNTFGSGDLSATAPSLSGTVTGTYTLGGTPTITAPTLSGTVSGTYTLGGTLTLSGATLSGNTTLPGSGQISSAGFLGIGATGSASLPISVADNQNASSSVQISNNNASSSAAAQFVASNGTHSGTLDQTGTGAGTGGVVRTDGTLLFGNGPGGLTLATIGAAQPVYFGVNNVETARFDANGNFRVGQSGAPTVAANACGSTTQGTVAAGSTNNAGQFTAGTVAVTTCTITFANSGFTFAPRSIVLYPANATAAATGTVAAFVSAISATTFTVTGTALASASYYYLVF